MCSHMHCFNSLEKYTLNNFFLNLYKETIYTQGSFLNLYTSSNIVGFNNYQVLTGLKVSH